MSDAAYTTRALTLVLGITRQQHYQFVMDKQKRAVVENLPDVKYVPKIMCPKKEARTNCS